MNSVFSTPEKQILLSVHTDFFLRAQENEFSV